MQLSVVTHIVTDWFSLFCVQAVKLFGSHLKFGWCDTGAGIAAPSPSAACFLRPGIFQNVDDVPTNLVGAHGWSAIIEIETTQMLGFD